MALIDDIARALGGATKTPSGYLCKCPCHDDKSASLSIKEVDGGTNGLIFNCFAGCTWDSLKQELTRRNLLEPREQTTRRRTKYEGAKFYVYKDIAGNPICRKVKLPDKKMWFERWESGEWIPKLGGLIIPLYNLEDVIASDLVYLCEGEKDAETLIGQGLVATTNHAGALQWAPHLTDQLRGKSVVIIPDNDAAGKKRVQKLTRALQDAVKELRVFIPDNVPEHGDITDWINAGNLASDILSRSVALQLAKQKKASRDDYYQLFDEVLSNPNRCIFNEKLMTYDPESKLWNPAINSLDVLKSEAIVANESREAKFCVSHIAYHFASYEKEKPAKFLIEIPDWDGTDRISAMAYLVKLKSTSGVSEEAFSELLKEWCANVFRRLQNPMIQNRVLVLQGGQGIGKDTWISMLVDGLGQFSVPLSVMSDDKDTYLNLHRGLVMKISEFDKTAKTEVSTLKDIITAPSTNLRAPYDKDAKLRMSRCSFISSANVENLLRDSTGNRRFLIFEVDSIEYAYHGWSEEKIHDWQIQCLAQMQALAEMNYAASPESWLQINDYILKQTPSDAADDMLESFIAKIRALGPFVFQAGQDVLPSDSQIIELITALSKETGIKPRGVKSMLQSRIGVFKRLGAKRYWAWRIPEVNQNGTHYEQESETTGQANI